MIRSLIAFISIYILTFIFGVATLLGFAVFPGGGHLRGMARAWSTTLLAISGVRIETEGTDRVPRDRSCVYMANHRSHYDVLALMKTIPTDFRAVAKKSLFYIPVFGWTMSLSGFISIDRKNRKSAFKSIDAAARKVANGMPMLIFPEGTRNTKDCGLLPFKKGAFVLAVKAGVPIVPVAISGSEKILPKKSLMVRKGVIRLEFGEPIETSNFTVESKNKLIDKVRRAVGAMLEKENIEQLDKQRRKS